MMTLADTVELMNSEKYKERFAAEYWQTKIRYDKLHKMLVRYEAGTLPFTFTCPVEVLRGQAHHMGNYLTQLEIRAEIEDIDLESPDWTDAPGRCRTDAPSAADAHK